MTEARYVYGYGYGAPGQPLMRVDATGRSISLTDTPPRTSSVLFTGGPGMGKTAELNRFQEFAQQRGWPVFRVDASAREGLENRFARAVGDDLGDLRKQYGFFATRKLKKTLRDLFKGSRKSQHGLEARTPPGLPTPQLVYKYQFDGNTSEEPTSTLNELSDRIGELAARNGGPAVIMIDSVDRSNPRDLAAVIELTEHLKRSGRQVLLVASGGEQTASMLMKASRGMSGAETDILQSYDIRECRPFTADELRPALAAQLAQGQVRADPAAMQALLESASGSPQRLQRLGDAAVEYGGRSPIGVTPDIAEAVISTVNEQSKYIYKATWDNSSAAEHDLITAAAVRGDRGVGLSSMQQAWPDKAAHVEEARRSLVDRGVMRESGGRLTLADPGMLQWAAQRVRATQLSVPVKAVLDHERSAQQTQPQVQPKPLPVVQQGPQTAEAQPVQQSGQQSAQGPGEQGHPLVQWLSGQPPLLPGHGGNGERSRETGGHRGPAPERNR